MKEEGKNAGTAATVLSILGLVTGLISMVMGHTQHQLGQAEQRIGTLEEETRRVEVSIEHRLTRIEEILNGRPSRPMKR